MNSNWIWDPSGDVHKKVFYENFEEAIYCGRAGRAVQLYQSKIAMRVPFVAGGTYLELGSHSLELTQTVFNGSCVDSSLLAAVDLQYPKPIARSRVSELMLSQPERLFTMVQADVADLPFADQAIDVVFHGCLLHHLEKPLKTLNEIRRVTRAGGTAVYYLPCEPGLLLRLIQVLLTQRIAGRVMKRRRLSVRYLWAIEHRNHFASLREMIQHVHMHDSLKSYRYPFQWRFWNLNLFEVLVVTRRRD
jgi:SAM-dependent methyltransferase